MYTCNTVKLYTTASLIKFIIIIFCVIKTFEQKKRKKIIINNYLYMQYSQVVEGCMYNHFIPTEPQQSVVVTISA